MSMTLTLKSGFVNRDFILLNQMSLLFSINLLGPSGFLTYHQV